MSSQAFQEIRGRAIVELGQALGEDSEQAELGRWDPDAFEHVVGQFTPELGQQMLQVWAEVRIEQAPAQASFVPVVAEDATGSAGSPSGG